MPWKETSAMFERYRFVEMAAEMSGSIAELCRRFRVSRQTGYKWLKRYEPERAFESLQDKPRANERLPHQTPAHLEDAIVELRKQRPTWGPKKLRAALAAKRPTETWPATSSIGELLKRKGMVRRRRLRVHTSWNGTDVEGAKQ